MFRSIAFRFITLSLGLAGGLLAQGAPCPDQVIEKVETRVTTLMPQVCGTNLSTTIGGVQISTQQNVCPLLVLIRPGHDTTIEIRSPLAHHFGRPGRLFMTSRRYFSGRG